MRPDALPRSPLASLVAPRPKRAEISFCKPAARLILRGREDAARAATVFGPAPPLQPLRAAEKGARAAIWQSPDEWLLIAEDSEPAPLIEALGAALARIAHGLVDVSHRQAALEIAGPGAARLLSAGVPLDLDLSAFPVGMATRTLLVKADILLWRRGAERFRLEFGRSFSTYVVDILAQAAADQEMC
ncbi:MAG TPA: sarcosine oxidase subunit gamma family protein [Roseiarcus sp.]|nr:sarcosine oxidase subunit gamma family protein [Roseiarcus sp.]